MKKSSLQSQSFRKSALAEQVVNSKESLRLSPTTHHLSSKLTFLILLLILFSTSAVLAQNHTAIEEAFECLEEKAGDCTSLTTQEIALTIMATPGDDTFDDCVEELKSRNSSGNWGNILDTSLAIIALHHAGENTEPSVEWLMQQNKTPTELIWYLQQNSNGEVECHIGYDGNDYTININENKKINRNAGSCLTRAQSNFWLQVDNNCYDKTLQITCDQDFIANLIYRNQNSPIVYVLEGTPSAPAYDSVELIVKSKCFGDTTCDYEATAWATLALLETGQNVDEYIPYIIAMSETNERYLPLAFTYIMTNYEDYANDLILEQKLGNFWEAKSSNYNKYYDTGLALLALSSLNAGQITKAKGWLLFTQGANGCWNNEVRETAMVLWGLEGREGRTGTSGTGTGTGTGGSITTCLDGEFFCIQKSECIQGKDVSSSYSCYGTSTCCTNENLKSCEENNGEVCTPDKECNRILKKSTDTDNCCTGTCEEKTQENECESYPNYYTCYTTCPNSEEEKSTLSGSCDRGKLCCGPEADPSEDSGSLWWIWVLIILILITLGAIGYVYREQLKLYWFQLKTRFKKDEGKKPGAPRGPGIPPRPGFPPIRRGPPSRGPMPPRPTTARPQTATPGKRSYDKRDKAMSDTFERLRKMSR